MLLILRAHPFIPSLSPDTPCRKWLVGISVSGGLAAVDVRDFASDPGIHSDFLADVFDSQ